MLKPVPASPKAMALFKYNLRNGNVLIWLGTGEGWNESEGIDNVMITHGGNLLFMKTVKSLSILKDDIKSDLSNLSHEQFSEKHNVSVSKELLEDLKKGLAEEDYPPKH